jgi:dipeptidyl aminopeptidase/acylaminoacyl peptidase
MIKLIITFFIFAFIAIIVVSLSKLTPRSPLVNFSQSECRLSQEAIAQMKKQTEEGLKLSKEIAKLYDLKPTETLKDITQELLQQPYTSDQVKAAIANHFKYYIFSYPSDGLIVKGYVSVPPDTTQPIPLIILLRGGQQLLGLPLPRELSTINGYSVVATTNRGGVSEGKDEFGGQDVNDVKNLIDFLPTLEQKLHIHFHLTNKYMVALSRGGMQMFLALERYPELQKKVKKIVSISGLLNIERAVQNRSDFKANLQKEYGFSDDEKGKKWIADRQAINTISKLSKKLPIMIAQGTADTRVCLIEGYDMLQALHDAGHLVTYVEIGGGNHLLTNSSDFTPVMMEWLEKE